jgi:hypothetical protein
MLQAYVAIVLSISDVCCSKCFILQVFHKHAWQGVQAEVVPSGAVVSACAREAKQVRQQVRSTKLYPWAWQQTQNTKLHPWTGIRRGAQSCIHGQAVGMDLETKWSNKVASMGCFKKKATSMDT